MNPWLTVLGVGADGTDDLPPAAQALIDNAQVIAGGDRHLEMLTNMTAARVRLQSPIEMALDALQGHRGKRVVALASGDPLHYGIAATFLRRFAASELQIIPHHSAFTLAAARMAWPRQNLATLSVHGRPLAALQRHIHPGVKLLVLAQDGETPTQVAELLKARGFGPSLLVAFEHLGSPDELTIAATAESWAVPRTRDLVTLAVECIAGPNVVLLPLTPGLPDDAFEHDGQLTKRETRAVTLSTLAPKPGEMLWDVGAGAGSIAIEWLRGGQQMRAIAFERDPVRAARTARNALALGAPELRIVEGAAPQAFAGLPAPDAIFLGGGVGAPGMIDACWTALRPGGRLIANAVTEKSALALEAHRASYGGELTRLAVSRFESGGWRELKPITQLRSFKA
ncbi:MAG TPA: precorrin-6y C5,15-methyltransferase (decarboxylating) subunit CbiE [Alphaproteobacteria bacterium]|nr:precorrin-6y C5,15-methyltransferase (decarboxylating) subunit CbiE [Alphaproteobacteria bacterium]